MTAQIVRVGDRGTEITLSTGRDLSGATLVGVRLTRPDGTVKLLSGTVKLLSGTVDGTSDVVVKTDMIVSEFDVPGAYICSAYIESPLWNGHGSPVQIMAVQPNTV